MDFDNRTLEEIIRNPNSEMEYFTNDWDNCTFGNYTNNETYYCSPDNGTAVMFETHPMAITVQIICANLGFISVFLNLFVIAALLRYRHRVLSNVFYVIVLHCAILDVVRGCCLIVYGLPHIVQSFILITIRTNIMLIKSSLFALFLLKICNLLTIFNLLVFTTNEFIVIRYPLHYRRYFRRKAVFVILGCCWLISGIIGFGFISKGNDDAATSSLLFVSFFSLLVLGIVVVCYSFILRTIRRFKEEGCLNNDENHRVHNRSVHRPINSQSSNCSNGSRWRGVQAMSRHKYIYVIGSVLIVDLLFLFPYSGIQVVSFLHIKQYIEVSHYTTVLKWWLQVLIGIHSVCQPLCYFRMTEFRRLACCDPRRPWNRTKSFSQMNKSFANTRSQMKDDDNCVVYAAPLNEPLLKDGEITPARSERSIQNAWTRGESVRFRTYGSEHADRDIELESVCANTIAPLDPNQNSPLL
ncbi:unnamed protein product [Caenorhabditis angaria]|uniref:G-protein coupled receptors family 1 profile domain-containing protein n=1 Tax=Caenorhabditis angaria TaxID=860376 RepID=A0A9P1IX44_9PELO|nr:unnamed protein product [Caenorhabditis angaria]